LFAKGPPSGSVVSARPHPEGPSGTTGIASASYELPTSNQFNSVNTSLRSITTSNRTPKAFHSKAHSSRSAPWVCEPPKTKLFVDREFFIARTKISRRRRLPNWPDLFSVGTASCLAYNNEFNRWIARNFVGGLLMRQNSFEYWSHFSCLMVLALTCSTPAVAASPAVSLSQHTLYIDGDQIPGIPGSSATTPIWIRSSSDGRVVVGDEYTSPSGSGNAIWAYEHSGSRLIAKTGGSPLYDDMWLQGSGAVNKSGDILLSTIGTQGWSIVLNHNGIEQFVAQNGQHAQGFPSGVVYDFDLITSDLRDSGVMAVRESISGPGITSTGSLVYWVGMPNDLKVVARRGDPVPGLPNYTIGSLARSLAYNSAGMFAIQDEIRHVTTGELRYAIWAGLPGAPQLVAFEGATAPGTSLEYAAMPNVSAHINDFGKVSFIDDLNLPGTQTRAGSGYWYGTPSFPQLIVGPQQDTPFGPGTRWTSLSIGSNQESSNELAIFSGSYTDTLGSTHRGIFKIDLNNPSDVQSIAEIGQQVSGISDVRTYTSLFPGAINQYGDVLFTANVSGLPASSGTHGMWLVPAGGQPQLVGLRGQKIDVDDGPGIDLREVRLFLADASAFESRSFVFRPNFSDNKAAVIQFQVIPEPTTTSLVGIGLGTLLAQVRRRKWRS
jgi:hypothetical protein